MESGQPDTRSKPKAGLEMQIPAMSASRWDSVAIVLLSGRLPPGLVIEHSLPLLCMVWISWETGQGSEGMTSFCPAISEVSVAESWSGLLLMLAESLAGVSGCNISMWPRFSHNRTD